MVSKCLGVSLVGIPSDDRPGFVKSEKSNCDMTSVFSENVLLAGAPRVKARQR